MTARREIRRRVVLLRLWAWLTLFALCGQLAVTGAARPGEMPRATIERLTGEVITRAPTMEPACGMDMSGAAMVMLPHPSSEHRLSGARIPAHDLPAPGHDADLGCFLCPLLTLTAAVLHALPTLPLMMWLALYVLRWSVVARAPPSLVWCRALPRGPPLVS